MKTVPVAVFASFLLLHASAIAADVSLQQFDLSKIPDSKDWKVIGRKMSKLEEDGRKIVRFDQQNGVGMAWITDSNFTEGTIEVDLRGKDAFQHSFLGVAFRINDQLQHDAVYFRPFNFKSDDGTRKSHAVQYISSPNFGWQKLRKEKPGVYENTVSPTPDPNGWFHAKIVISKRKVSVYVDNAKVPCLVVDELSERKGGAIGIWVGDQSGGDFANLKISPAN
jgi:hypothetical protein